MFHVSYWIKRLSKCTTIESIAGSLSEFADLNCWTLVERAQVSATYTPIALNLLKSQENYQRRLDDLAELCWNKR